ncbi:MAG: DUF1922 domain-containing protein [Pirellulaceae bacterium]
MKVPLVAGAVQPSEQQRNPSPPAGEQQTGRPVLDAVVLPTPAPQRPAAETPSPASILIRCSCGKVLRTPESSLGKAIRCPCGRLVQVTKDSGTQTTVQAAGNPHRVDQSDLSNADLEGAIHLPPEIQPAPIRKRRRRTSAGAESSTTSSGMARELKGTSPAPKPDADRYSAPRASATGSPYASQGSLDADAAAHSYLQKAEKEIRDQDRWFRQDAGAVINGIGMVLIAIGFLAIAANGYFYATVESQVEQAIEERPEIEQVREELTTAASLIYAFYIGIGCVFIFLGIAAYFFPFGAPLTALILYVLLILIALLVNPFSVLKPLSLIVEIVIIAALLRAVNNGAYYAWAR